MFVRLFCYTFDFVLLFCLGYVVVRVSVVYVCCRCTRVALHFVTLRCFLVTSFACFVYTLFVVTRVHVCHVFVAIYLFVPIFVATLDCHWFISFGCCLIYVCLVISVRVFDVVSFLVYVCRYTFCFCYVYLRLHLLRYDIWITLLHSVFFVF